MPDKRQGFGIGQSNGIIYVGGGDGPQTGGSTDVALGYLESYNPGTNVWTELPSMLSSVEYPACAVSNNNIYFFGGDDGTNVSGYVQGYVASSNSWGYGNNDGFTPRTKASATVLNGIIYVIGGYNTAITGNQGGYLGVVEAFNPSTGTWNDLIAGLGTGVAGIGVAVLNGTLYVFGGITSSGPTSLMAAYNSGSNSWTYKSNVPFGGAGNGLVVNGILYAFSDVTDPVDTSFPTVYAYNPTSDTWTSRCPMPVKRAGFQTVAVNNALYAIGGLNSLGDPGLNEEGGL